MKLSDYLEHYLQLRSAEFSENTASAYRGAAKHFGSIASVEVADISVEHFYSVKNDMLKAKLSAETIKLALRFLHSVLSFALESRATHHTPPTLAGVLKTMKGAKKSPKIEPFTQEEVQKVLACISEQHKAFFTTWAYTGARPMELAALTWDDIDFENKRIFIGKQLSRNGEAGPTKNGKTRLVPMLPQVHTALLQLRKSRNVEAGNAIAFVGRTGEAIDEHISAVFKRACIRAGVVPRKAYCLRHSLATSALESGVPITAVSSILGHHSVEFTMRRYITPRAEVAPADIEKLVNAFKVTA